MARKKKTPTINLEFDFGELPLGTPDVAFPRLDLGRSAAALDVINEPEAEIPSFIPLKKSVVTPRLVRAEKMEPLVQSVTQLTRRVRELLESGFTDVWVEGEISNLRRQGSGHIYFTLKDAGAQLSAVLFRGAQRASLPEMADGQKVQILGSLSVYEPRGQYQIIVKEVQAAGLGALQMKFEALKRQLAAEGLFDTERKKVLPTSPRLVGLITSSTGAAVRDMIQVLGRRAPWIRVVIYPVRVQGAGAAEEIVEALQDFSRAESLGWPRPDVLIVGRGGGSIEDLWAFNEEIVARAIAACEIPIVSAVGHEIDFTIADFVADLRAPTPSAAAELISPDQGERRRLVRQHEQELHAIMRRALFYREQALRRYSFPQLARLISARWHRHSQAIDFTEQGLHQLIQTWLSDQTTALQQLQQRLTAHRPDRVLTEKNGAITLLATRLQHLMQQRLERDTLRLDQLSALHRSLGPASVLARGYSLTLQAQTGRPVSSLAEAPVGSTLHTHVKDGLLVSQIIRQEKK